MALVAAFIGGYLIRGPLGSVPVAHPIEATTYIGIFVTLLPFWILVFALLGLYNSSIYERRFPEAGRLFLGTFIGLMFVTFWAFMENQPIFPSKLVPIYGFLFGFALVVIFRNIARMIRTLLFRYKIGLTKILIVGKGGNTAAELSESLANSRQSGYEIVGIVGAKPIAKKLTIPAFSTFKEFLKSNIEKPDGIVQAELYAYENKNREILNYAQENHVSYRFVPGNSELFVGNLDVELFRSSLPVIAVHRTPLFGWGRVVKRAFDILASLLALIILSPIFLLISLTILVFDFGPIFFRQERITRFDGRFRVYKFRTMKRKLSGRDPVEVFRELGREDLVKIYGTERDFDDPRISFVGKFLRRYSLDELPQLFNVLKGDISLVGPRAIIAEELKFYEGKGSLLLAVKTGITGLAQVSGRLDIDYYERSKIDLYYVQNWSFWMDVMILLKTVRVVLSHKGAK